MVESTKKTDTWMTAAEGNSQNLTQKLLASLAKGK